jgi:hypothetical protein
MKCEKCKKLIYLFSELDISEKRTVYDHIAACEACYALYQEVQQTRKLLQEITPSQSTNVVNNRLTDNIMNAVIRTKSHHAKPDNTYFFKVLQHRAVRYSLGISSTVMVAIFFAEFYYPTDIKNELVQTSNQHHPKTVLLNSDVFYGRIKRSLISDKFFRPEVKPLSLSTRIREYSNSAKKLNHSERF